MHRHPGRRLAIGLLVALTLAVPAIAQRGSGRFGFGALFATWIGPAAGFVTLAGLAVHAFGMWDKHRVEKRTEADADRLVLTLYWVCWLMLGGVLLYLVV